MIKCVASLHRANLLRTLQFFEPDLGTLLNVIFDIVVDHGLTSLGHGANLSFVSAARQAAFKER